MGPGSWDMGLKQHLLLTQPPCNRVEFIAMDNTPYMLMADDDGNVFEHPRLRMLGATGRNMRTPESAETILLPYGADLHVLPGRYPVGWDTEGQKQETVEKFEGNRVFAVSAFLPPAHTALLWSAFRKGPGAPVLPLFAYAAVGWTVDGFATTAVRIDPDTRQDIAGYPEDGTEDRNADAAVGDNPGNRLLAHLAYCCKTYRCPAARNLFLGRFEAPLPTAPGCNSSCLGCISLQEGGEIVSTQDRIKFVPTPEEIAEIAVDHIRRAASPVVSFGQGGEGEPLTQAGVIAEAIELIRKRTSAGTINMNTNGSRPEELEKLFEAGLDSVRISLNSARKSLYEKYFQPSGYSFEEVVSSMELGVKLDRFVSINYFVFPGVTDNADEADALEELISRTGVHMIQWRNLNIDPDLYMDTLGWNEPSGGMGMLKLMDRIHSVFPGIRFGYFNPEVSGRLT